MIDAIHLAQTNNLETNSDIAEQIHAFIDDAIEDCVKAKHDAIDAVISFVIRWFSEHESKMGLGYIQKYFPSYLEITAKIADIQQKIEESREDRTAKRDSIYDAIERDGYDRILDLYTQMRVSEKRVSRIIAWEKIKDIALWVFGVIGAVSLIATVLPHWFVLYP